MYFDISVYGKKPEFILAASCNKGDYIQSLKEGLTEINLHDFVNLIYSDLTIRSRNMLDGIGQVLVENALDSNSGSLSDFFNQVVGNDKITKLVKGDISYRQLLPYTVFKLKDTDQFFTYRRTKQVGETRLAGNASIGIGGHIDLSDVVFDEYSRIDLIDTIMESVFREISEEIDAKESFFHRVQQTFLKDTKFYLLKSNSNEVGMLHLGIVSVVEVINDDQIKIGEDELENIGFKTKEEIMELNPEDWTKVILNSI